MTDCLRKERCARSRRYILLLVAAAVAGASTKLSTSSPRAGAQRLDRHQNAPRQQRARDDRDDEAEPDQERRAQQLVADGLSACAVGCSNSTLQPSFGRLEDAVSTAWPSAPVPEVAAGRRAP